MNLSKVAPKGTDRNLGPKRKHTQHVKSEVMGRISNLDHIIEPEAFLNVEKSILVIGIWEKRF